MMHPTVEVDQMMHPKVEDDQMTHPKVEVDQMTHLIGDFAFDDQLKSEIFCENRNPELRERERDKER